MAEEPKNQELSSELAAKDLKIDELMKTIIKLKMTLKVRDQQYQDELDSKELGKCKRKIC